MREVMVRLSGVTKHFGDFTALQDVSLEVGAGEIVALLGPNGAGKSTVLRSVVGLVRPSAGRVEVLGLDPGRQPARALAAVGYLPQPVRFPATLTVMEIMTFVTAMRGAVNGQAMRLLEEAGLEAYRHQPVARCSGGMVQKLGLAIALAGDPRVLVLDEPTSSLDSEGIRWLCGRLRQARAEGKAVILSSHYPGGLKDPGGFNLLPVRPLHLAGGRLQGGNGG